VFFFVVIWI